MKDIKLFVFDLDGTLLNNDSEISEKNLLTCLKWQKNHKRIAIATGRSMNNAIEFAEKLKLSENNGFFIANNGAQVFDFKFNQFIFCRPIKKDIFLKIWNYFSNYSNIFLFFFDNDKKIMYHNVLDRYNDIMKHQINYHCFTHFQSFRRSINSKTINEFKTDFFKLLVVFSEVTQFKDFSKWLDKNNIQIECFFMGENTYELVAHNVSKGRAVEQIIKKHNWTNKEVIVVGDNGNDISMFQKFPNSFAPSNFNPIVKKYVNVILKQNNNQNIAVAIENYFKKMYF